MVEHGSEARRPRDPVSTVSSSLAVSRELFLAPTEEVARRLLGRLLVRTTPDGTVMLRLTEVEAYLGVDDPACHTYGGRRTPRTETMWGPAGRAYVYLVYGLHHCLNAVTREPGRPEAVLIRAGVPVHGGPLVRQRRGPKVAERHLADGPGKLCQALAVDRDDDGADLCDPESGVWLADDGVRPSDAEVKRSGRIGVDYAGEAARWPLRLRWVP